MRATVCCVVMGVVMVTVNLKAADLAVVDICLNRVGNQTVPDIDQDVVVWQSDESGTSNTDIYWKHFGDPNDPNWINISGKQLYPVVGGPTIVFQDERDSDKDIYGYNTETRTVQILRENDGVNQRYPEQYGGFIVCEHYTSGYYNAAVFNSQTNQYDLISPVSATQTNLAISGSMVVWQDNRSGNYDIYLCDLSVRPYAAQRLTVTPTDDYRPAISGDIIVWEDHTNDPDFSLVAYSISAGAVVWTCSDAGEQSSPAVSGSVVVWQEKLPGRTDYDIRGCDIGTGACMDIATTNTKNDQFPAVSGRRVVWQRDNTNKDIIGAVIPTPTAIAVDSPGAGQQFLAQTEMEIGWHLVDGTAPANVKVEFAPDGVTWQTLAASVPFAGTYLWQPIADVDSTQCKIRISDPSDALVSAVSGGFTIFQCQTELTADLTDDCFVDVEDFAEFAAQWLSCGNSYNETWCVNN